MGGTHPTGTHTCLQILFVYIVIDTGQIKIILNHVKYTQKQKDSTPVGCISPASVHTTRCQYWLGVGPQVNKFEQVSSDDHQKSVVGRGGRSHVW